MVDRVVVPLEPGFTEVFRSHHGIVGRDLLGRARRVQYAAQRQVGIDTGELRRSIHTVWFTRRGGDLGIRVGSSVRYAYVHHHGTKPRVIKASKTKPIRWVDKSGKVVFATEVHYPGTRPNRYLTDNLPLAVR